MKGFICILLAFLFSQVFGQTGKLTLTIAYCPTIFTAGGAIVSVDYKTGDWNIDHLFHWPSEILGCPALDDATVAFDSSTGLLYMYFTDDSFLTVLDVKAGKIIKTVEPSDIFFTGFVNMAWSTTASLLKGLSGIPDDDGRYQYGYLTTDGKYSGQQQVPFKAMMDDSHFYDETNQIYWVQGSYDQRSTPCAPDDSDLCLLSLDGITGEIKNSLWTNWTIYKYGPQIGNVATTRLVWMEGFETLCNHPYNDFLFAQVDLMAASAKPVACIPQNVTVDMDEWIASFSLDGKYFSTGSGDTETGVPQLLVFDTSSGNAILNSKLDGLAERLKSANNFFLVWSVDWV